MVSLAGFFERGALSGAFHFLAGKPFIPGQSPCHDPTLQPVKKKKRGLSMRTTTEAVADLLSQSVAEVRQTIQDATETLGTSREDAIEQIINSLLMDQRTPSERAAGFAGRARDQGRVLLNFAHNLNQKPINELRGRFGGTDIDENSLRIDIFSREVAVDRQRSEQILNIARDEAARTNLLH